MGIIHETTINGEKAFVVYLDANFKPVDESKAILIKVVFENGKRLFLQANKSR